MYLFRSFYFPAFPSETLVAESEIFTNIDFIISSVFAFNDSIDKVNAFLKSRVTCFIPPNLVLWDSFILDTNNKNY